MNLLKISVFFVLSITCFSCKSKIKQNNDSVYSRHLQRHVPLTIITTPLPSKKEEMNLLLFNNISLLEAINTKKIIDSLYKNKLLRPIMLVAFDGKEEDYGFTTKDKTSNKQIEKYNKFLADELFPFVKKKAGIDKFNIVASCGLMNASKNALEVVFNDGTQFQKVGIFSPQFTDEDYATLQSFKKNSGIKIYVEDSGIDSSAIKFGQIVAPKQSTTEWKIIPQETGDAALKKMPTIRNFAAFLLWAFSK